MDWNNYLLDSKAPGGTFAHLGVLQGEVHGVFDLSKLPSDTRVLDMSTPLKKFKLKYTNLSSLRYNEKIEAISLDYIDEERLSVFSTFPNFKYLDIGINKQEEIPNLSCLKNLEVLILADMMKVENIDFVKDMKSLKTLYIYGIYNLYDLRPISTLKNLEELSLDHGKMTGFGKAIKSIEPLSELTKLKYLKLFLNVENKDYDITPLLKLKKLQKLLIHPRYLNKGQREILLKELPLLNDI